MLENTVGGMGKWERKERNGRRDPSSKQVSLMN